MAKTLTLELTLEPQGPAGAFVLTDEQVADLGDGKKVFPVRVTVNGTTLTQRLSRMGGQNLIGFARAAREQAGMELGGTYPVELTLDDAQRSVDVPADLAAALAADPAAETAFAALSYTHRKEFARWVVEAKREATRVSRVARAVEMVVAGQTL